MKISINITPRAIVIFTLSCLTISGIMAFRNPTKQINTNTQTAVAVDSAYGVPLTLAEYNAAKNNWISKNPAGAIRGGSISRDALMEVINSMAPENATVSLYFGKDISGRTFVMIAPASATNESKIFRNGSYCPNNCN